MAATVAAAGAAPASAADYFEFDAIPEQTTGTPFSVTIRAKLTGGATDTSFNGTVDLSVASGSIAPSTSNTFVGGVLTQTVTVTSPFTTAQTISATDGSAGGTSAPFTLHDHRYYFKKTTAHTGSGCAAAWAKRDMEEGYLGQDPEETHRRYTGGAEMINFCSPSWTTTESFSSGTALVRAYVNNSHGSTCNISATLLKNGTVSLGSVTRTVPPQIPVTLFTWAINTTATTMGPGDKVNLRFQMQAVKACQQSEIHYGGTVYRSSVHLLAGAVAPVIGSGPGHAGSDLTPTWTFTGEVGATFECRLEDEAGQPILGFDWAACSSPRTYNLIGLPDGPYTFAVRQTVAGITSQPARSDYLLDTAAPAAATIDASPPSPSSSTSVSWTFSGEDGASFQCRLLKGAAVISDWAACVDSQGYTLADGDGTYTFEVQQTDEAGNPGPVVSRTYELDTGVPAPPSIVLPPPSPGNDATPTWMFMGEAGALLECRLQRGATVISDWAGCLSPRTYDLSGEPDGSYTFSVRQTDSAGNVSAPATSVYVLDTAAGGAPAVGSGPGATGNDPTPTWSFSGDAGASFTCRLEDGAGSPVPGYDWSACSSPATFDLSAAPDGAYSFLVRQTDAAGNTSPPARSGYVLDTAAPAPPALTASPPAEGSATNPTWSFTGEAGAGFECRVARGPTVVSDWAGCSSPHALDLSGEPDGLHTFSVRAVDAAGNRSAPATDDYALDRLAPAAPVLTGSPEAVGNDPAPAWSFSAEAGTQLECRLDRGGIPFSNWQPCTSPASYDLTGAPDGTYRFRVRAGDAAGNLSPEAESSYDLDRLPPPAPTIDSGPGPLGADLAPAWSFTGEAGAVHECRLTRGGDVVSDWAPCAGSSAYDLGGQPDGDYLFEVRGRDQAGNVGAAASSSYTLDTAGAGVTIESGPLPTGSGANPAWSFAGEPAADFECRLELAGAVVFDWAACTSPHAYDLSSLPDGGYTFYVRSRDDAGNFGEPVSYAYVLDRVAPGMPEFTVTPPAIGNEPAARWEFVAEAGAVLECALERDQVLAAWEPCASGESHDLGASGDGAYALQVRATDAAGNVSPSARSAYLFDGTAPGAPEITDGPGGRGEQRFVSWAFAGEAGAAFECRLTRGTTFLADWASCSSPRDFDLSDSEPGNHTFAVRATDTAGNTGGVARSDYELVSPAEEETPREEEQPRDEKRDRSAPAPPPSEDPGDPGSTPAETAPAAPDPPSAAIPPSIAADAGAPPADKMPGRPERGVSVDAREKAEPAPPTPADEGDDSKSFGERLLDALGAAATWTGRNLDKTAFPLFLLGLVFGYLTLQNRFDRRDPKLALAPVHADSTLEFLPPPSLR